MTSEVFRVAAELETTAAAKVPYLEGRVIVMKDAERFAEARVSSGTDPSHQLNLARFYRLQAEADLLILKEQLVKK